MVFQLDSAAAFIVLREADLPEGTKEQTTKVIKVYNEAVVEPIGVFHGNLTNLRTQKTSKQEFIVVRGESNSYPGVANYGASLHSLREYRGTR